MKIINLYSKNRRTSERQVCVCIYIITSALFFNMLWKVKYCSRDTTPLQGLNSFQILFSNRVLIAFTLFSLYV